MTDTIEQEMIDKRDEIVAALVKHKYESDELELLRIFAVQLFDELKESNRQRDVMREALEKLACLGNGDYYGNSDGNRIAQQALKETSPPEGTTHEMCEHGKGLTDYCEPCGRIHGEG